MVETPGCIDEMKGATILLVPGVRIDVSDVLPGWPERQVGSLLLHWFGRDVQSGKRCGGMLGDLYLRDVSVISGLPSDMTECDNGQQISDGRLRRTGEGASGTPRDRFLIATARLWAGFAAVQRFHPG